MPVSGPSKVRKETPLPTTKGFSLGGLVVVAGRVQECHRNSNSGRAQCTAYETAGPVAQVPTKERQVN